MGEALLIGVVLAILVVMAMGVIVMEHTGRKVAEKLSTSEEARFETDPVLSRVLVATEAGDVRWGAPKGAAEMHARIAETNGLEHGCDDPNCICHWGGSDA
jgi:hypothetical protein